jgi:CheY-like chemotaxis protein
VASVLIVEADPNLADLARAVLADEGYQVSVLGDTRLDAVRVAVGQLEPDCMLLDVDSLSGFGDSSGSATWLHDRARPVPTILLTAQQGGPGQDPRGEGELSQPAGVSAVLARPFDPDALLEAVARCAGLATPFDRSERADADRTAALVEKLWAAGARDIRPSTRREWAQFRTPAGALLLLYWSQRDGVYYVMRHTAGSSRVERVGQFYDRDAAITLAMTAPSEAGQAEPPADQPGPAA